MSGGQNCDGWKPDRPGETHNNPQAADRLPHASVLVFLLYIKGSEHLSVIKKSVAFSVSSLVTVSDHCVLLMMDRHYDVL